MRKTVVLVFEFINLGFEIFDLSSELFLGHFECRGLALFIIDVTNHRVDLDHVLFVLLLLGLQFRLLDGKLNSQLIGLFLHFSLNDLRVG